jgi:hypothetical protein
MIMTEHSLWRFSRVLQRAINERQFEDIESVSLRVAHFAQFKLGRLLSIRVVVDTFDLVERVIGQPIHLPKTTSFA